MASPIVDLLSSWGLSGSRKNNAAVRDMIEKAMSSPSEDPLYVVAIGAITNVASALLLAPEIIHKIVVVWLGGHHLNWPHTREFNLAGDVPAAQVVLDSGVPFVIVPCRGVTSHLLTTLPELRATIGGTNPVGNYLCQIFKEYRPDSFGASSRDMGYLDHCLAAQQRLGAEQSSA